tara:strand:- start:43972 stop:44400 length:429 start_codon:yes stop_codon:yes gene_type:complete
MTSNSSIRPRSIIQHPLTLGGFSSKQTGFSLIELLISLLIFAVGFLGLASLQHVSIKMTHDTALQNAAIALSSSLVERVRAEGDASNLSDWQARVKKELPQGQASLLDQGDYYQLTMQWQESQHSEDPSNLQVYELSFKINP